ncbi:MAG: ABC transporter substrate-binding protein, partial [Deltaproteobacteria bacterium]|nr:ABC transporter substrate-binding protein [Deltaproteobacteria bacterium]
MNLSAWNKVVVVVAAAIFAGGGCDKLGGGKGKGSGSEPGSGSGSNPAVATGPILVGHYASLTGAEATFGVSTDRGVILAMEERNAAGGVKGRKIALKTLDDASKSSEAGNVVQRLISEDKVVALIGEVASGSSLAGGKVAQQFGVPMISPSSTNKKVTEGRDMVSRVCFLDEFQGYVVAKFAKDQKLDKVAV